MRTDAIPYSKLPGIPRLFVDFQEHFDRVRSFYSSCSGTSAITRDCVERLYQRSFPRAELVGALGRQASAWNAPAAVRENISRLSDPQTVAVVTGQQIGVGGGPALVLYKTVTALQSAAQLNADGVPAVPMFWMPTEDHDFEEVRYINMPDSTGHPLSIRYGQGEGDASPVGARRVDDSIAAVVKQLRQAWPDATSVLAAFEHAYLPGRFLAEAFARFWTELFGALGLILIDPSDPALKTLQAEVFRKVLLRRKEVQRLLGERNDAIQAAGYPLQVNLSEGHTLLLVTQDGRRSALIEERDRFRPGEADAGWSQQEVLSQLEENPERFSPNVLLRPVIQDSILPTVCYVGGPAEIAYYAQLQPLFRLLGEPEPVVRPRLSLTVLDGRARKLLERYRIQVEEIFDRSANLAERMLRDQASLDVLDQIDAIERSLGAQLDRLAQSLEQSDRTIAQALDTSRKKISYQLDKIRTKFVRSSESRSEIVREHLGYLRSLLLPEGELQERAIHSLYFLCRFGTPWLEQMVAEIRSDGKGHQVWYL